MFLPSVSQIIPSKISLAGQGFVQLKNFKRKPKTKQNKKNEVPAFASFSYSFFLSPTAILKLQEGVVSSSMWHDEEYFKIMCEVV